MEEDQKASYDSADYYGGVGIPCALLQACWQKHVAKNGRKR